MNAKQSTGLFFSCIGLGSSLICLTLTFLGRVSVPMCIYTAVSLMFSLAGVYLVVTGTFPNAKEP